MRRTVQQQQQQQQRLRASALCSPACVKALGLPALLLFTFVVIFNRHFQLISSPFSKHTTKSHLVSVPSPALQTPLSFPSAFEIPSPSTASSSLSGDKGERAGEFSEAGYPIESSTKASPGAASVPDWLQSKDSRKLLPLGSQYKPEETDAILPRYKEPRSEQNAEAVGNIEAVHINNGGFANLKSSLDSFRGQPRETGSAAQAHSNGQLKGQRKQVLSEPEWDSEGYVSAGTLRQLAQEASINGTVVILVCSYALPRPLPLFPASVSSSPLLSSPLLSSPLLHSCPPLSSPLFSLSVFFSHPPLPPPHGSSPHPRSIQGYADFLLNWAVYAGELGYGRSFLVFAEDRETFELLRERFPRQVVRWHVPEIEQAGEEELKAAGLVEEIGSARGGSAGSSGSGSSREAFSFLTLGFKKLMYRRVAYIRTLLNLGFNVLICDSDFIWVKDPFPYLFARPSHSEVLRRSMASRLQLTNTLGLYNKKKRYAVSDSDLQALPASGVAPIEYDVVGVREFPDTYNFYATSTYLMDPRPAQLDHAKLCGGFVLFRNTPGGRLILELLILKIYRAPKVTGRENDQLYLGMVIYELLNISPAPLVGVLPQTLFPPGWLYFPESSSMPPGRLGVLPSRDAVVTIHNNWMSGKDNKLARFKTAGLWRISDTLT
ncbi:unnamed protein product [Closterium sp. NIES-54]